MKRRAKSPRSASRRSCGQSLFQLLSLVGALAESAAIAQVQETWARRYHGPGPGDDAAAALKVDRESNVYVTGWTTRTKIDSDYATIKYAPNGTQLWIQSYAGIGNSIAAAIELDGSGNVYVTGGSSLGSSSYDYATIKYSPDGATLWVQRYSETGDSLAVSVAVDSGGSVYVTGASEGNGTGFDYATVKYAPDGTQLWVQRYDGPAKGADRAAALALDGAGNVFVTGSSEGMGTGRDYATVKYSSEGSLLWVQRYDGPTSGDDDAVGVGVDGADNAYVTGHSAIQGSAMFQYVTIKYSPEGIQLWTQSYSGPGNGIDTPTAIAVDRPGNAYVTGASDGAGTDLDYATLKYSPEGTLLWVQRYDGDASGIDSASSLALDAAGNVYVTGFSENIANRLDYATIKYDPDGNFAWRAIYDGPGHSTEIASDIEVDASGNVYVTGSSDNLFGPVTDYATVKYTQQ